MSRTQTREPLAQAAPPVMRLSERSEVGRLSATEPPSIHQVTPELLAIVGRVEERRKDVITAAHA